MRPRNTLAVSPSSLVRSQAPFVPEKLRTKAWGWLKMVTTRTSEAKHSAGPNDNSVAARERQRPRGDPMPFTVTR